MADGGCLEVFFFDCFVHGLSCHLTFFVGGWFVDGVYCLALLTGFVAGFFSGLFCFWFGEDGVFPVLKLLFHSIQSKYYYIISCMFVEIYRYLYVCNRIYEYCCYILYMIICGVFCGDWGYLHTCWVRFFDWIYGHTSCWVFDHHYQYLASNWHLFVQYVFVL